MIYVFIVNFSQLFVEEVLCLYPYHDTVLL